MDRSLITNATLQITQSTTAITILSKNTEYLQNQASVINPTKGATKGAIKYTMSNV